ncbi:MAG: Sec-independent protein translocase protein TatB [Gammaproteobacteria bacterium]|jgi:sec-independent protein translocase protein TatB|nr:Sec-independent protein translocase protein TatB [Gammaproteobacteria bacterium]|tara:strand:- start:67 stop:291 length:225 start_codon:yes stop_codon:yes gene_type:complete
MFDIGFWEMLVLCVLGLLVLGPNKLPEVAIKIGNYLGRARSMVNSFSRQMRQEIELTPMRPDVPQKSEEAEEKE